MITVLLILAAWVALSILLLLWLCLRAPVIEEPDMSWPGHAFRIIEHEPTTPLDQRFRQSEGGA